MNKKYILSAIALGGFMTSCYDLNTEPVSSVITADQREEIIEMDEAKISGLSDGIYKYYNEFEWFAGTYSDFGYPAIMLQLDSRTEDFISANADYYGWFAACAEYLDNTATSSYNTPRWGLPYGIIYAANELLAYIPEDTDDNAYKYYRAQAYGNRAFAYWVLAQLFQFNYVGHEDYPCVPLITEKNYAEVQEKGAPRASVQAIYDQILSDLNTGLELVKGNPSAVRMDKRYIDENVLLALRARTYLCMQKYEEAAADAEAVINSGKFIALSPQEAIGPGFNDLNASNWIWGIYYYMEDVVGLYTLPGMMGSYTYGYAYAGMWKCITDTLFAQIEYNDPRKLWWIDPNTMGSNADYYTEAVPDPDTGANTAAEYLQACGFPEYSVTKFAPFQNVLGQSNNQSDIPMIRIEEMYLILAESQYMSGNAGQGILTLENFVNDYRWLTPQSPYSFAATGKDFMEEIYFQREVEMWGEGMTYYDIMRLNLGVYRKGTSWEDSGYGMDAYAYDINPGDPIFLMQIPQSEIDNNPMLTPEDQNPTGTAHN